MNPRTISALLSAAAIAVISSATTALLIAADTNTPAKKTNDRDHAAVGYSDTPVIPGQKWKVHDIDRPRPKVVTPANVPGGPPSDAVVLFDGKDLSKWVNQKKGQTTPAAWKVENGYV